MSKFKQFKIMLVSGFCSVALGVGLAVAVVFGGGAAVEAATLSDNAGQNVIVRRNVDVGEATWPTAFVVHYNNERHVVLEGERGLTRAILFDRDHRVAIAWAERTFGDDFRADGDGGGFTTTQETFEIKDKEGSVIGTEVRDVNGPNESANF